jgi:hypothetical protein
VTNHIVERKKRIRKPRVYRPTFDLAILNQREVLNVREFAYFIGVSVATIQYNLGNSIPFFRIGARVLIRKSEALASLEKSKREAK